MSKLLGILQVVAKLDTNDLAHLLDGQVAGCHLFTQASNNL